MTLPGGDSGDKSDEYTSADAEGATPGGQGNSGQPPQSAPPPAPGYPGFPQDGPPPQYGPGYGQPYPPVGDQYGYGYAPPQQITTNTMAIASLVMSVLGIVPFCGNILSIVGIVLGAVALSQIKETRQEGYGIAVTGIVVGVAMLIVGLIWTIFALR